MSEFRKIIANVEELERDVARLQDETYDHIEISNEKEVEYYTDLHTLLTSVQNAIDDKFNASIDKYRQRYEAIDPVTNEYLYGPKMREKMKDMIEKYDQIKIKLEQTNIISSKQLILKDWEDRKHAKEIIDLEIYRKQQEELEQERQERDITYAIKEQEEKERRERELQEEIDRRAQLAIKADKVRIARAQARAEEEKQIEAEKQKLKQLNELIQVGPQGLKTALDILQKNTNDKGVFTRGVHTLDTILSNICSSPEKEDFRSIPIENTHFHEEIGQFHGGHQCMLALGFQQIERAPGDMIFYMKEPDLAESFDIWTNWFDTLKEMKEILSSIAG